MNANEMQQIHEGNPEVNPQSELQERNDASGYFENWAVNELGGIFDVGEIIEACQIIGF